MAPMKPIIVWFRQDLRIADNPALAQAAATGAPLVPVYVLDDETPGRWRLGGASRWWLHHALLALQENLAKLAPGHAVEPRLVLRRGRADSVILALARELDAGAVHWNRCYEPFAIARDKALKAALAGAGIGAESFNASLLHEPWTIQTGAGGPFKIFTPFWNACQKALAHEPPVPAPKTLRPHRPLPAGDRLEDWRLLPTRPDWAAGLRAAWKPGETAANCTIAAFLCTKAALYGTDRDRPDLPGTSRLSPHLHFGEIGPRQIAKEVSGSSFSKKGLTPYMNEIGWREFAHHLLYHFPALPEAPLRPEFACFPWRDDEAGLAAWQRGLTGYPVVDAAMRQLWQTGWMHNRMRMVAASFLVKHLLIPWQRGAAWFWDTLVDADLASNSASWQWVAGSGTDAAPYFRIFNPVAQGERYDPDGAYVRLYVPELAKLPSRYIHQPWVAPAGVLDEAGVRLGRDYPRPIVDHAAARARALAAFQSLKQG